MGSPVKLPVPTSLLSPILELGGYSKPKFSQPRVLPREMVFLSVLVTPGKAANETRLEEARITGVQDDPEL